MNNPPHRLSHQLQKYHSIKNQVDSRYSISVRIALCILLATLSLAHSTADNATPSRTQPRTTTPTPATITRPTASTAPPPPPPQFSPAANNPLLLKTPPRINFAPPVNNNTAVSTPMLGKSVSQRPAPRPQTVIQQAPSTSYKPYTPPPANSSFINFAPPVDNRTAGSTPATLNRPMPRSQPSKSINIPPSPPKQSPAPTLNAESFRPAPPAALPDTTSPGPTRSLSESRRLQTTPIWNPAPTTPRNDYRPPPPVISFSPSTINNNVAHTTPAQATIPPKIENSQTTASSRISMPATIPEAPRIPSPNASPAYAGLRVAYPLSPVPAGQTIGDGQCTTYANDRFVEVAGTPRDFHGSANEWFNTASKTWVTVGPYYHAPPPGSIAVYDDSVIVNGKTVWQGYGHVAVVEENTDKGIQFSEQNWPRNGKLDVSTTTMSYDQYQKRAGLSWKSMKLDEKAFQEIKATKQDHIYRLQGFVVPVTQEQNRAAQTDAASGY